MKVRQEEVKSNYPRAVSRPKWKPSHAQKAGALLLLVPYLPGLATMYNGQVAKGLVYLTLLVGNIWAMNVLLFQPGSPHFFALIWMFMGGSILYMVYLVDTIEIAKKVDRGVKVGKWDMF